MIGGGESKLSDKKRLRDITWNDYGISEYRYRELKNFCLQYLEKKEQLNYGLQSRGYDGVRSGQVNKPTEGMAIENIRFSADCNLIEACAKEASVGIWPWILKSVTEGLPYEDLAIDGYLGMVPICRNDFYGLRRRFYSILDARKKQNWGTN